MREGSGGSGKGEGAERRRLLPRPSQPLQLGSLPRGYQFLPTPGASAKEVGASRVPALFTKWGPRAASEERSPLENVTPRAVATLPPARTMSSFSRAAVLVLLVASGGLSHFSRAAAQIGPPEVQLEAEDTSIIINISPPGTINSSMWATHFTYSLVIWKNSSSVEETRHTVYSGEKINDLLPETTYCLKVQARLPIQKKSGSYSPTLCINTTAQHKLPRPENVEVDAVNNYILKWNYPYENMNFQVQYLLGYYKRIPSDYSDKWKTVSDCKRIVSRHCDFSEEITTDGIYYLRVQASNGTITSFWSAERKFDTRIHTRRGPPSIVVKPHKDSLSVYINVPGESEKKPTSQDYPLIYEVIYWENASNIENKMIVKQKLFEVSDLKPLTLYCLKVRALLDNEKSSKGSQFSNVECSKITPDEPKKTWIIVICFIFVAGLIFIAYGLKRLQKLVKYVFYPSCKPPSNMDEWFSNQPLKNLLVTSEEQTESCIIEKANIIVLEETNQNGKNDVCNKQDNHDSGNYSNEDETSSNKMTEEKLEQETMQLETV